MPQVNVGVEETQAVDVYLIWGLTGKAERAVVIRLQDGREAPGGLGPVT